MNSPQPDDEGLQPLIDAVTEGGPAELAALERAASAAQVAFQFALPPEQAPNRLRQRLREDIARFAAPSKRKVFTVNFGAAGWMAAAASLGLCFYLWRSQGVLTLNSEVRFEKVVASSDLIRVDFGGGLSGSTSGEVLWSTSLQAGFLHLKGLAVNKPTQSQYQLWIVDPLRDPNFPVDGGVFDIKEAEAIIPIRAKLGIYSPQAFVITSEQPGGIVKSRAEKPVLLASIK